MLSPPHTTLPSSAEDEEIFGWNNPAITSASDSLPFINFEELGSKFIKSSPCTSVVSNKKKSAVISAPPKPNEKKRKHS